MTMTSETFGDIVSKEESSSVLPQRAIKTIPEARQSYTTIRAEITTQTIPISSDIYMSSGMRRLGELRMMLTKAPTRLESLSKGRPALITTTVECVYSDGQEITRVRCPDPYSRGVQKKRRPDRSESCARVQSMKIMCHLTCRQYCKPTRMSVARSPIATQ